MTISTDLAYADRLDAQDVLGQFRKRFMITDDELIYMDGNSLGRLPVASAKLATQLVQQQWGTRLIRSWNEGWFTAPERIGAKIARLIGAHEDEVIVAESTSINLFKLVMAALRFQAGRSHIMTDDLNFPRTSISCRVPSKCWTSSISLKWYLLLMGYMVLWTLFRRV
ncbi:hypothetical protein KDW_46240 [Dictyobacter vulcani]|uniref:Aminotransferase class V domain-containing protein n=1 Tax=Dictyobacter vulcani TaxID=2607529 RepID=A0A5J4KTG8_9CHLR|nr:hypothetical protein [Dictyobacter vulcani]GER90462.1 hypothetical protein KDW_46240 [Dictyobacter vulcani]